jgi:hypothetical protein
MTRLLALPLPFTRADQPLRSFRAKSPNRFKLFAFLSIVRHEKMLNFIKKRRVEIRQSLYIAMRRGPLQKPLSIDRSVPFSRPRFASLR